MFFRPSFPRFNPFKVLFKGKKGFSLLKRDTTLQSGFFSPLQTILLPALFSLYMPQGGEGANIVSSESIHKAHNLRRTSKSN